MLRVLVCPMTVEGGANTEEKFETVTEIVAVVAVESVEARSYGSTWLAVLNAGLILERFFTWMTRCLLTMKSLH